MSADHIHDEWSKIEVFLIRRQHSAEVVRLLRHTYYAGASTGYLKLLESTAMGAELCQQRIEELRDELRQVLQEAREAGDLP